MDSTHEVALLNKATISYAYLHANSTTHESLLGAAAELVDNSRDAKADKLEIYFDEEIESLNFLDDGCGMLQSEVSRILMFGYSNKSSESGMIGQYGNGLKSGAMRISKNMMLFTKKAGQLTCMLLSRSFHEHHGFREVFVPTPSFNENDRHMCAKSDDDIRRHGVEMSIIYEWSPFKTQEKLFQQFDKIKSQSGTLIVLYDMRHLMDGRLELDFDTNATDIRLTDQVHRREEEYNSFRSYLAVLYLEPRMKMYLRGEKVKTVLIISQLHHRYKFSYTAKTLKGCAQKEHEKSKADLKAAEEELKQAQSEVGAFNARHNGVKHLDKDLRMVERRLNMDVVTKRERVKRIIQKVEATKKAINNPTPLELVFGLNLHYRNRYGCMFYNNGRLILGYQKVQAQKEQNDIYLRCLGVVGIVDVPYSVLAPTHNKQSFENQREYQSLLKAMNEHMQVYWKKVFPDSSPSKMKNFWAKYGYKTGDWSAEPQTEDAIGKSTRYQNLGFTVQCDNCLKWRKLDFSPQLMHYQPTSTWKCSDNANKAKAKCSLPQDLEKIKELPVVMNEKQIEPVKIVSKTQRATADVRHNIPERAAQNNLRRNAPPKEEIEVKEEEDEISGIQMEVRPTVENSRKAAARIAANVEHNARKPSPQVARNTRVEKVRHVEIVDDDVEEEEEEAPPAKRQRVAPVARTSGRKRVVSESEEEPEVEEPASDSDSDDGKRRKRAAPKRSAAKKVTPKSKPEARMAGQAPSSSKRSRPQVTIYREDSDEEQDDDDDMAPIVSRSRRSAATPSKTTRDSERTPVATTSTARNGKCHEEEEEEEEEEVDKIKVGADLMSQGLQMIMHEMGKKGFKEAEMVKLKHGLAILEEIAFPTAFDNFWQVNVVEPAKRAAEKIRRLTELRAQDLLFRERAIGVLNWLRKSTKDLALAFVTSENVDSCMEEVHELVREEQTK